MKILVYGAGAIGCLFGTFAARRHEVTMVGRRPFVEAARRRGLGVQHEGGEERAHPRAETRPPEGERFDLAVITVKTYDLAAARDAIAALEPAPPLVLCLQNGIGNEEILAERIPAERLLRGLVYHGASVIEPGLVHWFGRGRTIVGRSLDAKGDDPAPAMAEALTASGFPTMASDDMEGEIWRKLAVNAAINPIGAITGLANGELLASPRLVGLLREVERETGETARAETGRSIVTEGRAEAIARSTAGNRNSMLLDLEAGKPTEIDFLSGAVVRRAERHGLDAPACRVLTSLVRGKEESRRRS